MTACLTSCPKYFSAVSFIFCSIKADIWEGEYLLPLASNQASFLSDLIIGLSLINLFVYLSFIVISGVGYFFGKINIKSVLTSSLIFFFVTNFGVWLIGYPNTIEGFIACFVAALPFFGWTIAGDLFYSYSVKFSLNFLEKKYISNPLS